MKRWLSANRWLLLRLLEDLDTPVSLSVAIQLKHGRWDDLALRWVDPQQYLEGPWGAHRYRRDVQSVDLLRKAPLPTRLDRKANALKAWEDAETQCYITNEFILGLLPGPGSSPLPGTHADFLQKCKRKLARWLGPIPSFLNGGFGPGTCVEYEGSNPCVVDKLWLRPTTTPSASAIFRWHYDQTLWGQSRWAARCAPPGISRGNRLTTVPKDGKTDRPISIEPLGNLWLQLGIGRHLKKRDRKSVV